MPVELQIIRAAEFIRMSGRGEFDLAASCAVLSSLAKALKKRGINRALLDGRNARAELTPAEMESLVNAFCDIGFTRNQRLAILHSADRYQRARLFAFISRMKGWNVRAFGDFEEALHWLSSGQTQAPAKSSASAKRLHVNNSDGEAESIPIESHRARKSRHNGGPQVKIRTAISRKS